MGHCLTKVTPIILSPGCSCPPSMGHCLINFFKCGDQSQKVQLAGGNVHFITTIESWEEKLSTANEDGKIVVANFSTSWCRPCKTIAPAYCKLAKKYNSLMFLTVDVDELAEFSNSWDIKATPTFFFLKDGREVDKLVGANKAELKKKVAEIADSLTRNHN